MSKDFESMTMEEYFTHKASCVEEAIVNHCNEMCDLIMMEYESSRAEALKEFEEPPPTNGRITVKLEVISGIHAGQVFVIYPKSGNYPIIGRSTRDDVVNGGVSLPKDNEVSSYHGKFFIRGGQLKYKDTHSTNHSYINGELVEQDITLKNGDVLSVGQTELKITIIKNNQAN